MPRTHQAHAPLLRALTPFTRMGVAELYGTLGARGFTADGLYLNLGYWREATTIDEACPALAALVAERAGMGPGDTVVDVGFGFADQDMLWAERFQPAQIIGLNITPMQLRLGRARVRRRGLADRIDLREGSATAMPLPDACCDVVTAVECAFHFDTRADFLAEAHRVLRPGGRLVLADVIRAAPDASPRRARLQNWVWRRFAESFTVPAANADRSEAYAARFAAAGFAEVDVAPIGAQVFPGWHGALRTDAALRARLPLSARLAALAIRGFDAGLVYGALDYVLAFARKPAVTAAAPQS
jgi:ubiquinone/menaquinone biosynthesis C-methylase UbiE